MDNDRRQISLHVTDRGKSDVAGPSRVTAESYVEIPMATSYKRILPKFWSDSVYITKKPRPTLEIDQRKMFNYESRVSNRIVYTKWQLDEMERVFSQQPYPDTNFLNQLSTKLDIPLKKLRNWFQNRRTKLKKRVLFRNPPVRNCDLSVWTPRRTPSVSIPMSHIHSASSQIKNSVMLVYSDMYSKPRMVSQKIVQSAHNQANINSTANFQKFPPNAGLYYNQPINNTSQYSNCGYFPLYFANYGLPVTYNSNQLNTGSQVDSAPINNPALSQYYNSLTQAQLGAYYMQLQNRINQIKNNQNTYHTLINVNMESKNSRDIGPYSGHFQVPGASDIGYNHPRFDGPWTKQGISSNSVPGYNPGIRKPSAMPKSPVVVPTCGKTNLNTRAEILPGLKTSTISSSPLVVSRPLEYSSVNKDIVIGSQEWSSDTDQKDERHKWQSGPSPCSTITTTESSNRNIPLMTCSSSTPLRQPYPIALCRAPFSDHTDLPGVNKVLSHTTVFSTNQDKVSHTGSNSPQTSFHNPLWAYVSTLANISNNKTSATENAAEDVLCCSPDFRKNPVMCDKSEQSLSDDDGFSSTPSEKSLAHPASPDSTSSDSSSDEQISSNCWSLESNRHLCLDSSYEGFEFLDVNQNSFEYSNSSYTGCSNLYNDSGIGMDNVCVSEQSASKTNQDLSALGRTIGKNYSYNDYVMQGMNSSGVHNENFISYGRMPAADYRTCGHLASTSSNSSCSYQERVAYQWNNVPETRDNNGKSCESAAEFKHKEKQPLETCYHGEETKLQARWLIPHQDCSQGDRSQTVERGLSEDIEQPDSSTPLNYCVAKRGILDVKQLERSPQFPGLCSNYSVTVSEDEAMDDFSDDEEQEKKLKEVAEEDGALEHRCHGNKEVQSQGSTASSNVTQSLPDSSEISTLSAASQNISNSSDLSVQSSITPKFNLPSISSICSVDCRRTCVTNKQDFDRMTNVLGASGHNYNSFRSIPGYSYPENRSHDSFHDYVIPRTSAENSS